MMELRRFGHGLVSGELCSYWISQKGENYLGFNCTELAG